MSKWQCMVRRLWYGITGERMARVERRLEEATDEIRGLRHDIQELTRAHDPIEALLSNMRESRREAQEFPE